MEYGELCEYQILLQKLFSYGINKLYKSANKIS